MIPLLAALLLSQAGLTALLDRTSPDEQVNYLVVDVRTRQIVAQRWPDAETPIPVGSLVKPFLALAYGGDFPSLACKGRVKMPFVEALAQSCNAYFLQLARAVPAEALQGVATRYAIQAPASASAEARIGLGRGWKISPLALARAYAELSTRSAEPAVAEILRGLDAAARHGTSAAVGAGALAKTGTAPCSLKRPHAGDGFTLVLDPAEAPRIALLVRVHNVPGAEAARTASEILKRIRAGT